MADQANIFQEGNAQPAQEVQNEQQVNVQPDKPFNDLLKGIADVNGRQKYNDVESALQSIPHAQNHINTMERELAELRAEKERMAAQLQEQINLQQELQNLQQPQQAEKPSEPVVSEDKIAAMVNQQLSAQQQQQVAQTNIAKVQSELVNMFGDKAVEKVQAKAAELGLSMQAMEQLATSSPNAVLAYFNQGQPAAQVTNPTSSSVNFSPEQKTELGKLKLDDLTSDQASLAAWRETAAAVKARIS